jgi:hypothetical protein
VKAPNEDSTARDIHVFHEEPWVDNLSYSFPKSTGRRGSN